MLVQEDTPKSLLSTQALLIQKLERALIDYAERYGMTEFAREALICLGSNSTAADDDTV